MPDDVTLSTRKVDEEVCVTSRQGIERAARPSGRSSLINARVVPTTNEIDLTHTVTRTIDREPA